MAKASETERKFFYKDVELDGAISGMKNADFARLFPDAQGRHFWGGKGMKAVMRHPETKQFVPVEREINYKLKPSMHTCDARCVNATGLVMNCECSCGGKNHGKGGFTAHRVLTP